MSRSSIDKFLREMDLNLSDKVKAYRKLQNTEETVIILDEDKLYNFILVQIYLMRFPVLNTISGRTQQQPRLNDTDVSLLLEGESLSEVNNPKENNIIEQFTNKAVPSIRKLARQANNAMLSAARKLVKSSSGKATNVSKLEGVRGGYVLTGDADKFSFADIHIFSKGSEIVQSYAIDKLDVENNAERLGDLHSDPSIRSQRRKSNGKLSDGSSQFKLLNIGHMYDSGVQLKQITSSVRKLATSLDDPLAKKAITNALRGATRRALVNNSTTRRNWEIKFKYHKEHGINVGASNIIKGRTYLTLESAAANSGLFVQMEIQARNALIVEMKKFLSRNSPSLKGSPSFKDDLKKSTRDHIFNEIDNTKAPRRSTKRKAKSSGKHTVVNTVTTKTGFSKAKAKGKVPRPKSLGPTVSSTAVNLTNMQAIINEHLPIYLQKNMGKGRSKEILNWRTGRFGESAKIKQLTKVKGTRSIMLSGTLDYMRRPYDVFRPGGRLHMNKPGRDPKRLIDRSIRQILKEKALSTLSFKSVI